MNFSPEIQIVDSLATIRADEWDRLTADSFPFLDYGFLRALELSRSVGAESGWLPRYVVAHHAGALVGACATFVKVHSYGEYIFDWQWAHAAQSAGLPYYPKLVIAAPFTPATGPKFLIDSRLDTYERFRCKEALLDGVHRVAQHAQVHSVHWLFTSPSETEWLAGQDYISRLSHQFHWKNEGYRDFEAFLTELKARKRKQIHKERKMLREHLAAAGLELVCWQRNDLQTSLSSVLYRLYRKTVEQYGSYPYLTASFFDQIIPLCRDSLVVFALCAAGGEAVAMSLCFKKGTALFGRYWGAEVEIPFLHFELCYYQPIELAIREGLALFEAGAQGPHKVPRGFLPALTYSAHRLEPRALHLAVERAVASENAALQNGLSESDEFSPFRKTDVTRS